MNPPLSAALHQPVTVLHIFSGDLWAGAEVMIFNLLTSLKDYPDIKIIALSLNKGTLSDKLAGEGIETHVIPEENNSFMMILVRVVHLFRKRKIDVIHSHRYKENLLAFLFAKAAGVNRLITTMHGLSELHAGNNKRGSTGFKTKMDYFILRNYFTRIVAVSQEMKHTLTRQYAFNNSGVEVIYNGIKVPASRNLQPAKCNLRLTNRFFHVGTVGRMVPVKDFDLFLEAAAETRKRAANVRFSILGDGPLKNALIQKAKALQIEDAVEFLSPRPDPMPYYLSLDLYLNTSLHEGMPLSILEAMACGVPVIAPNVGGISEVISHGENGFLVDDRDPKQFAQHCVRLIDDVDTRIRMGEKSFARVASFFQASVMADSYKELYFRI